MQALTSRQGRRRKKRWYSPVGTVSTPLVAPASLAPRAGRAAVRLATVTIQIGIRLRVATRRWRGTVAVVGVATTRRRRIVVHRWTATRRAVAVIARILVIATRRRSATAVVITTRAVATRRSAAIVVVVIRGRRSAVATPTTMARGAGAVALARAWDVGLRLCCESAGLKGNAQQRTYVRDAADGRALEAGVVELLDCAGQVGGCLVLDEASFGQRLL